MRIKRNDHYNIKHLSVFRDLPALFNIVYYLSYIRALRWKT